jgi:ABC-type enterochelin transport system ATPase subunit
MIITKQLAINHLNYFQHKITLKELVTWAENAFMEGDIQDEDTELIRDSLAQLGLADFKTFGIYRENCDNMMKKLG